MPAIPSSSGARISKQWSILKDHRTAPFPGEDFTQEKRFLIFTEWFGARGRNPDEEDSSCCRLVELAYQRLFVEANFIGRKMAAQAIEGIQGGRGLAAKRSQR